MLYCFTFGNIKKKVCTFPLLCVCVYACAYIINFGALHKLLMHSMFVSRKACVCIFVRVCEGERVRITINTIDLFTLVQSVQGQLSGLPLETLKPDY